MVEAFLEMRFRPGDVPRGSALEKAHALRVLVLSTLRAKVPPLRNRNPTIHAGIGDVLTIPIYFSHLGEPLSAVLAPRGIGIPTGSRAFRASTV